MRWAGLLILLASPAFAEPALISFEVADQTIQASPDDIELAELTLDPTGRQALSLRLHPSFDARFAAVTEKHIGEAMTLRICGQAIVTPVLMSQLLTAEFLVTTASDEGAIRLHKLLKAKSCPDLPPG
jgi:preprotein translocase subunit SecD